MLTANKVALMDFDGVILRNKTVLSRVANKATQYVQRTLDISKRSSAEAVNRYLYTTYGHTAIGLNAITKTTTLQEFNAFVYDDLYLDHNEYYEAKKELHEWCLFLKRLHDRGIPIHIFSNAPKEWCLNFIDSHPNLYWTWDYIPLALENLKPQMHIYNILEDKFSNATVYFVDDNMSNLSNARNWETIMFDSKFQLPNQLTVSSLGKCADIICA